MKPTVDLSMVPYGQSANTLTDAQSDDVGGDAVLETKPADKTRRLSAEPAPVVMNPAPKATVCYRECMRNHAASIGGHASDGCGEFMPVASTGGDRLSLTCAACGCHRNFHRRDPPPPHLQQYFLRSPPPPPPMLIRGLAAPRPTSQMLFGDCDDGRDNLDRRSETPEREELHVGNSAARHKRFRTKFTAEQKEKMLEFAEKSGWRIQKPDDVALTKFCSEVGVKRHVLKVWMHNNKNAHRRRESQPHESPSAVAPPQAAGV